MWNNDQKCIEKCEVMREAVVIVDPRVVSYANGLADKLGAREFALWLLGEVDETTVRVDGCIVPPQEASSASVEIDEEAVTPSNCVGILHSHHTMGNFFSSTDKETNGNFSVSIVISKDNESLLGYKWKAAVKLKSPCGRWYKGEAAVKMSLPYAFDYEAALALIKEPMPRYQVMFDDDDFFRKSTTPMEVKSKKPLLNIFGRRKIG